MTGAPFRPVWACAAGIFSPDPVTMETGYMGHGEAFCLSSCHLCVVAFFCCCFFYYRNCSIFCYIPKAETGVQSLLSLGELYCISRCCSSFTAKVHTSSRLQILPSVFQLAAVGAVSTPGSAVLFGFHHPPSLQSCFHTLKGLICLFPPNQ